MPTLDIDRLLASKAEWINKNLAVSIERERQRNEFELGYGSRLLYMGAEYPIEVRAGQRAGFDGARFYLPPDMGTEDIRHNCVKIYIMLAKRYLPARTAELAQQLGVTPSIVKINSAKTRWGSCSYKRKSINYSWRLMMADEAVIDYVILHELAHLIEPNHSVRFWNLVEKAMPDYKQRLKQLKALQKRLSVENW